MQGVRDRMVEQGAGVVSDEDLLTVVLGPMQAKTLLAAFGSVAALRGRTLAELSEVQGVGKAAAGVVIASLELGRRSLAMATGESLLTAGAVHALMLPLAGEQEEQFVVIGVNAKNRSVGQWIVARGWESGVNLNAGQVARVLVKNKVSRCIFVHNHPSGDATASLEDIRFTRRLLDAAQILDIKVLDHVIVAGGGFSSMRVDHGSELEFR